MVFRLWLLNQLADESTVEDLESAVTQCEVGNRLIEGGPVGDATDPYDITTLCL